MVTKHSFGKGPILTAALDYETRPGDAATPTRLNVAPRLYLVDKKTFHIENQLPCDGLVRLKLGNDYSHSMNISLSSQIIEKHVFVWILHTLEKVNLTRS
jgi:hypothetical protein